MVIQKRLDLAAEGAHIILVDSDFRRQAIQGCWALIGVGRHLHRPPQATSQTQSGWYKKPARQSTPRSTCHHTCKRTCAHPCSTALTLTTSLAASAWASETDAAPTAPTAPSPASPSRAFPQLPLLLRVKYSLVSIHRFMFCSTNDSLHKRVMYCGVHHHQQTYPLV